MSLKLAIEDVSKVFKGQNGGVEALRKISLDVAAGEFVCIVGPSGCGKSTLLKIVAGLAEPDSGTVLSNSHLVKGADSSRSVIFQDLALFPWLNVQKNVEFGLKIAGVAKEEKEKTVERFLKMVHLWQFKDAFIHELSGGMKQRVALARALAINPDILLMDEPFTALDAQTRWLLHFELQEIWRKTAKTILFITHNIREAVTLADRVIVMTARPAQIKKEFKIDLKRPRDDGSLEVAKISAQIMDELKSEIQKATISESDKGACEVCGLNCMGEH